MTAAARTSKRELPLRHAVATLAYRAAKALRDAPNDFAAFRPAAGRTGPEQAKPVSEFGK
jgi:hypothetical protein